MQRASSHVLLMLLVYILLTVYANGHSLGWQHWKIGKPQIYILRLRAGKFYVGRSTDVWSRFQEHMAGQGSSWTALHRPIGIEDVRPMEGENDENNVVKEMMLKHGWENVRGGSYSKVDLQLSDDVLQSFAAELPGAAELCSICGSADHWVSECPYRHAGQEATLSRKGKGKARGKGARGSVEVVSVARGGDASEQCCWRCGRPGHYANECYARRDVYGRAMDEAQDWLHMTSRGSHLAQAGIVCYRCGRPGHRSPKCYARRDVDGDVL